MTGTKGQFDERGMTLIEVVVYVVVVAMVLLVFGFFAISVLFDRTRGTATVETQEHVRLALARIEREIGEAKGIRTVSSTLGVNLSLPQYGGQMLSLEMASSTLDPTEIFVLDRRIYIRQGGSATGTLLTPDNIRVSQLQFVNYSTDRTRNLGIELTAEYVNAAAGNAFAASTSLRSAMELRAPADE